MTISVEIAEAAIITRQTLWDTISTDSLHLGGVRVILEKILDDYRSVALCWLDEKWQE